MNTYVPVPYMNREFFRGYAFMPEKQCPSWMDWCGGGPLDNESVTGLGADADRAKRRSS